jgi:putative inorganic carbon (HCO3(-)) transporter
VVRNADLLDKLIFVFLCALIFILPLSKSMLEVFFVIVLVAWILKRALSYKAHGSLAKLFKPVTTELDTSLLLFVLLAFLSSVISVSILLSIKGLFFKLLKGVILYFIVVETINTSKRSRAVLITMFLSMLLVSVDCAFQFVYGTDFIRHYSIMGNRLQGPFKNPNDLAAWLTVALPLTFCLLYLAKDWLSKNMKFMLVCLTGALIFCMLFTHSRGGWIAVMATLLFVGAFKSRKLVILLILAAGLAFFLGTTSIKERASSIITFSRPDRTNLWKEALTIIEDFPVFGCGLNTYAATAPKYKISDRGGIYTHNSYLQMAAESGLLGLGAFLWILITLFRISLAKIKSIDNTFHGAVLISLLAGLSAFLAHSFVDTNLYSLQFKYLMWFVIGLIIAVQRIALSDKNGYMR